MAYVKGSDFAPHNMSNYSSPAPFTISASTEYSPLLAWRAYDGLISGTIAYWTTNTGNPTGWNKIDIGSGFSKRLYSYSVRASNPGGDYTTRCPKDWTLEGSNNGSDWTVLDTQTNQTGWTPGLLRDYTLSQSMMGTGYRYFRINISANNGDANYAEIGEMYLYRAFSGDVTDDFNRADSSNLGTGWTESESSSTAIRISSNRLLLGNDSGPVGVCYRTENFSANQSASLTLVARGGNDGSPCGGPAVRVIGPYTNLYSYHAAIGSTKVFLRKHVNQALSTSGTGTEIGQYTQGTWYGGEIIKIEAIGTTIKVYVNDTERISVTDSSISTGNPGGLGNGWTSSWDDFAATGFGTKKGLLTFQW